MLKLDEKTRKAAAEVLLRAYTQLSYEDHSMREFHVMPVYDANGIIIPGATDINIVIVPKKAKR